MQVKFVTVDVFTDRQFGGNPLAVVTDGTELSTKQMQAIAAEFNLAETTFVLPPERAENTAKVRIFTPRAELPFAGHPNVGTAFVLAQQGECHGRPIESDVLQFEEIAGLVRIELWREAGTVVGASLAAPQPLAVIEDIPPEVVAEACTISAADIQMRHHRPCIASCGMRFVFAELKDLRALAAARPRVDVFMRELPMDRVTGIHLYVWESSQNADIQARMFAPLYGVPEDPATGSANVALIGLLAHLAPERDLRLKKTIRQGVEMGRPSLLMASANKAACTVTAMQIGGACVSMMRGVLELR